MAKVILSSEQAHVAILDALENALTGKTVYTLKRTFTPETSGWHIRQLAGEAEDSLFMLGLQETCHRPKKGRVSITVMLKVLLTDTHQDWKERCKAAAQALADVLTANGFTSEVQYNSSMKYGVVQVDVTPVLEALAAS